MKNIICVCVCLSFFNVLFSQTSGTAYYKFKVNENIFDKKSIKNKDKNLGGKLSLINNSLVKYGDLLEFELKFNNKASLFKIVESLQIDENQIIYRLAKALSGADAIDYLNIEEGIRLSKKFAYGENFIIKDSISSQKWMLINSTKKIGKYTCYKAITTKTVENNRGIFRSKVEAWYTPEIPLSFGPKGYGGLPGLILELQEKNLIYYMHKIVFVTKKHLNIKRPKNGKLISKENFNKIGKDIYIEKKSLYKN